MTQFSMNTINNSSITFFKWLHFKEGEAEIKLTHRNQDIQVKYHVADLKELKNNYPKNVYVTNYMKLLKFSFLYLFEDNRININNIERNFDFIQVFLKLIINYLSNLT